MGHSHYLRRQPDLDQTAFARFARACRGIIDAVHTRPELGITLAFEKDHPDQSPVANRDLVRFNGQGDLGYETFYVERSVDDAGRRRPDDAGRVASFCKTAKNPYDLAVVACYAAAEAIFGDAVAFTSDGTPEELEPGRQLWREVQAKLDAAGDGLTVIFLPADADRPAEVLDLPREGGGGGRLEAMQSLVGGMIQCAPLPDPHDATMSLFVNEEGKCVEEPALNRRASRFFGRLWGQSLAELCASGHFIAGDAFVAGGVDEEGRTLPAPASLVRAMLANGARDSRPLQAAVASA